MTQHFDSQLADERIREIAHILAAGLVRQIARQSSQIKAEGADILLDISAGRSGHPTHFEGENRA